MNCTKNWCNKIVSNSIDGTVVVSHTNVGRESGDSKGLPILLLINMNSTTVTVGCYREIYEHRIAIKSNWKPSSSIAQWIGTVILNSASGAQYWIWYSACGNNRSFESQCGLLIGRLMTWILSLGHSWFTRYLPTYRGPRQKLLVQIDPEYVSWFPKGTE